MKRIVVGSFPSEHVLATVDDEDYPLLSRHKWWPMRVRGTDKVYAQTAFGIDERHTILMHTLIVGNPPKGHVVDHINNNGLDNRKENLRFLWNAENIRRRYEDNPDTGIKLKVDKIENPWQAQVSLGGKTRHVGYFPTKELARAARDKAIEDFLNE
jgi:hypothetical protein